MFYSKVLQLNHIFILHDLTSATILVSLLLTLALVLAKGRFVVRTLDLHSLALLGPRLAAGHPARLLDNPGLHLVVSRLPELPRLLGLLLLPPVVGVQLGGRGSLLHSLSTRHSPTRSLPSPPLKISTPNTQAC